MPAFPLHGWMPDGYSAMPLPVLAVFSGVLSKVAAYGFLRICLPLFPDASVHFQELMLRPRAARRSSTARRWRSRRRTSRLVLGYSSVAQLGLHRARHLRAARRGRAGRDPAGGQPRARRRARVLHRRAARRARRRLGGPARHGRPRAARAGARRAVPHRDLRRPGDAGLVELRRRVHDPARRRSSRRSSSRSSPAPASCSPRSTRCGCSSARCTTASGRAGRVARDLAARQLRARPARARDPRAAAVPAARAAPQRALGDGVGRGRAGDRRRGEPAAIAGAPP